MYVNGLDFSSVSTIFLLDFGTAQTLLYPPLPILIIGTAQTLLYPPLPILFIGIAQTLLYPHLPILIILNWYVVSVIFIYIVIGTSYRFHNTKICLINLF